MLNEKYQMLLDQYDICTDYLKRGRGGVLCHTSHGIYALAQTSLSEERLFAVSQWTKMLKDAGFLYTDQYILNRNDCFLTYDKYYETYTLRKTFTGSECDIHSLKDLQIAASNLGMLHRISLNLSFPMKNIKKYLSIPKQYQQKYSEMKSIYRFIRNKKNKGTFEYLFIEQTGDFWKQMESSLSLLESSAPSHSGWCHGSYNHHNVLITDHFPATIHFEHFYYGYPILDLYYFLRKVLEKNNYRFTYCEAVLKNYSRELPLSSNDYSCLYGLFLFPEKFWKISNQYMSHKKHWVSPRYIDKLEEFVLSKELRTIFLEKYVQIYNVF
ncbi:phosphotransferase [Anaerostipes faecalis]|uniref:phosphotransferase n=1 Tax=Anaerostipes faecalis TaxID=2738446 RepID=UPI001E607994|nr:phosphotransferase [Anaerostipes faecalis]